MHEDKFYELVGANITQERLIAGVKQEDLATFLELSRASVVNIEKGRQRPSLYMLMSIAKYLGIEFMKLIPDLTGESYNDIDNSSAVFTKVITSTSDFNTTSKESIQNFLNLIKK